MCESRCVTCTPAARALSICARSSRSASAGLRLFGDRGLDERQVAVGVEQARHGVPGAERRPAKRRPLAVERQVDAEIRLRMRPRPRRHLREPRARHQDARGSDPALLERLEGGAVDRVRHAEIVGVDAPAGARPAGWPSRSCTVWACGATPRAQQREHERERAPDAFIADTAARGRAQPLAQFLARLVHGDQQTSP